jgi:uncharacterized protein
MLVIDNIKFTREKAILYGSVPVASLARVVESGVSQTSNIQYHVQGGIDVLSRPTLTLKLKGTLEMLCQRCLTLMPYVIAIDTTLTLFMSEEAIDAAERDDPDIEGIIFTEKLDMAVLIEDELLLALPYAPTHQECDTDKMVKVDKPNPFAVLAALKTKPAE